MDFLLTMLNKLWVQRGLACLVGAVGALGFAPCHVLPALLLSLSVVWFLLEHTLEEPHPKKRAFWLGWWFGLGHFTAGLYWITYALTLDMATFGWLIPFCLFGIPAILAVFIGGSFVLTALWPYGGLSRAFAFAAFWIGVEWLRGYLFTGFPWNLTGYAWAFSPEMAQIASFSGVYGLSLITLLLAISLQYLVSRNTFQRIIVFTLYLAVALLFVWGRGRLHAPDVIPSPPHAIRLVQPNIPQTLKWDPAQREAHFRTLLTMTASPSALPLKAVIWPESAVPFFLEQQPFRRIVIGEALPRDSLLLTGADRRKPLGISPIRVWNSLIVLDTRGEIMAYYDKTHLVPFGEYLPFRNLLNKIFGPNILKNMTAGTLDFTPGEGPCCHSLPAGFPSFTGLVCYEAIFPGSIVNPSHPRPSWLVNVTNDGWYGKTSGPYQHLESARFRAIEEGIPLVRVANSGISAVFDAYGQTVGSLALHTKGTLDVFLPSPTRIVPVYARWGDWVTLMLVLATLAIAWALSFREE